ESRNEWRIDGCPKVEGTHPVAPQIRVAHPLSFFDKGWGIAERPSLASRAMRPDEESGPSTTLRTCCRKRYPPALVQQPSSTMITTCNNPSCADRFAIIGAVRLS